MNELAEPTLISETADGRQLWRIDLPEGSPLPFVNIVTDGAPPLTSFVEHVQDPAYQQKLIDHAQRMRALDQEASRG